MRTNRAAFVHLTDGKLAREFPRPRAASAKPANKENVVVGKCQEMMLRII